MTGLPVRYTLLLDGKFQYGEDSELGSHNGIVHLLEGICCVADMRLLTTNCIDIEDITDGEWYGLSGIAMIATSHVSVHVWPHYDYYAMIDLTSCKHFEPAEMTRFLEENYFFSPDNREVHIYEPGKALAPWTE